MTMRLTTETANHRQATAAATMMWQPCVGLSGIRAFNRPSSLSLYALTAGGRLQESVRAIEGLTIKDRRHNRQI